MSFQYYFLYTVDIGESFALCQLKL